MTTLNTFTSFFNGVWGNIKSHWVDYLLGTSIVIVGMAFVIFFLQVGLTYKSRRIRNYYETPVRGYNNLYEKKMSEGRKKKRREIKEEVEEVEEIEEKPKETEE